MTIPLTFLALLIAFVAVKWGKVKISHLLLGVFCGLVLASTSFGAPILHGISGFAAAVVGAVSGAVR